MDPIDHSYALAAVEVYYKHELDRVRRNRSHWQSEIEANQSLIDESTPYFEEMQMKLASIRSLAATILPSAVLQ